MRVFSYLLRNISKFCKMAFTFWEKKLDKKTTLFQQYFKKINMLNYLTNLKWRNLWDNTGTLSSSLSLSNTLLDNDLSKIKKQRLEYPRTNIIGHLNINSVRNKFYSLIEIIKNFNIFLISESGLDASFPKNQFKINGYKGFRRNCN